MTASYLKRIVHVDRSDGSPFIAGVPWPVSLAQLSTTMAKHKRILLNRIKSAPEPDSVVLNLAAPAFFAGTGAITEIALGVDTEQDTGLLLRGFPEIDWLRRGGEVLPPSSIALSRAQTAPIARRPLKRIARTATMNSAFRLPRALLNPDVMAITHNHLLMAAAMRSQQAIGFRHADEWFARIIAGHNAVAENTQITELSQTIARDMAAATGVKAILEERIFRLFDAQLRLLLSEADRSMKALQRAKLPSSIWSGTGGYWPARAIGLEVIRRGGRVRRFDHGGGTALIVDPDGLQLVELGVSTHFEMATQAQADIVGRQVESSANTFICGGKGDPHFQAFSNSHGSGLPRKRVIYVTAPLIGFRKMWPPNLPDFVYLDWQRRLIGELSKLDIDLVLKPHPEGLLRGETHPTSSLAQVDTRPFEEVVPGADVVIFDYPPSTTFAVSLCSSCAIILIDSGVFNFDPAILADFKSRVVILPMRYEKDNTPQVNTAALAHAIATGRPGDPTSFRKLLADKSSAG